jgi:Ca2+-dependent lipid-binding protein
MERTFSSERERESGTKSVSEAMNSNATTSKVGHEKHHAASTSVLTERSDHRGSDTRPSSSRTTLVGSTSGKNYFHSRGREEKRPASGDQSSREAGEESLPSDRSERKEREREAKEQERAERAERKEAEMLARLASPRNRNAEDKLENDSVFDSSQRQSRSRIKEHTRKASHPINDDEITKEDLDRYASCSFLGLIFYFILFIFIFILFIVFIIIYFYFSFFLVIF